MHACESSEEGYPIRRRWMQREDNKSLNLPLTHLQGIIHWAKVVPGCRHMCLLGIPKVGIYTPYPG